MKRMRTILFTVSLILIMLSSCDFYYDAQIRNCTRDTLYIGTSQYDNFDSVSGGMGPLYFIRDSCILSGNVYLWRNWDFREEAVFPDSLASCNDHVLFGCNNDTGYIFIIPRQVVSKYTMKEIRSKLLYDKITVVRTKRNEGFRIDYMGKNGAAICESDRDHATLSFSKGKGLEK